MKDDLITPMLSLITDWNAVKTLMKLESTLAQPQWPQNQTAEKTVRKVLQWRIWRAKKLMESLIYYNESIHVEQIYQWVLDSESL